MNTPYASPQPPIGPQPQPVPGYVARAVAVLLAIFVLGILLEMATLLFLSANGFKGLGNPVIIVIGSLVGMMMLSSLVAGFWRIGNHFLYPETHGFHIRVEQNAMAILNRYSDLDLSNTVLPDPMYGELRLRQLLQVYRLMDRDQHPKRLLALIATIKTRTVQEWC